MRSRRALLAALLLLALLIGVEAFRRARAVPAAPAASASGEPPRLAPPAAPSFADARPAETASSLRLREPEVEEVTVAQLLGILAKRKRTPSTERFLDAFASRPALRRALRDFSKQGGDSAPARQLVRVISEQPEFRELLSEFRDDPGFREAVADAARDPRLGRALGGYGAIGPGGELDLAARAAGEPSSGGAASAPGASGASGPGAHGVRTRLAGIKRDVGERAAKAYFPSMFAALSQDERDQLGEVCDRHGFCEPVAACRFAELWGPCVAACKKSGKCPEELLEDEEPDVPIVVPDGF